MATTENVRAAVDALEQNFIGELVRPNHPEYDKGRFMWNTRHDRRPSVIARCTGLADVTSAVRFARESDIPFTVRAGGHEVDGWGLQDDVLAIDLSPMSGVIVDPRRRRGFVQAGARLRVMDRETAVHGLAVASGTVSDTGVGGLALGGGIGWLTRKFGATIDSLVGIDAVTADGDVIRVSDEENPDLFWAMRGGNGNFAIAGAFEFDLHPLPTTILAGAVVHPGESGVEFMKLWRDFMLKAPDEVGSQAVVMRAPERHWPGDMTNRLITMAIFAYAGDVAKGEEVLRPVREWGTPIADLIEPTLYTTHQQSYEVAIPHAFPTYQKCGFVPELTDELLQKVHDLFAGAPVSQPGGEDLVVFVVSAMGGAFARVPEESAAMPRGNSPFYWEAVEMNRHSPDDDTWIGFIDDVEFAVRPLSGPQLYLNHYNAGAAPSQEFLKSAYGNGKFERLVSIKNKWDPENVFRCNKNIKPTV